MRRQIGVLGRCRIEHRTLLMPGADGRLSLPGGVLPHGESPAAALRHYLEDQVGGPAEVSGVAGVVTVFDHEYQVDWIVFDAAVAEVGAAVAGFDAAVAEVGAAMVGREQRSPRWLTDIDLDGALAAGFVGNASALALAVDRDPGVPPPVVSRASGGRGVSLGSADRGVRAPLGSRTHQRFAAYGLVTDPAGRVLLTKINDGYPGAGNWHLPGGGTDLGEDATAGLLRELVEETDQRGQSGQALFVSDRHNPVALGPEGVPMDWHAVRVIYRVFVAAPTEPRVIETVGSTIDARWFEPRAALELPLTEVADTAIRGYLLSARDPSIRNPV